MNSSLPDPLPFDIMPTLVRGATLAQAGSFEEAASQFRRCVALLPNAFSPYSNLAWVKKRLGRYGEALAHYHAALCLEPRNAEVHWNLSLLLLLLGRFREGFAEYEWRWLWSGLPSKPRNPGVPLWNPAHEPEAVVWVTAEQGFGDTIQFSRWIPYLATRCRKLYFEVQPELHELFRSQRWPATILRQPEQPGDITHHLPVMSIPYVLGISGESEFASPSYLRSSIPSMNTTGAAAACRVGLVWRGRPSHGNDSRRSMSLSQLSPLFKLPGLRWFSLSTQDVAAEIRDNGFGEYIETPLRQGDDFAVTAALLCTLNLVITVDTSIAHLAGAMGIPCWILLPQQADWRWGIEGQSTPWYGSVRLFRCPGDLAWELVIELVSAALQQRLAAPV